MTDNTELKRAASASKNWGGEVGEGRWYAAECFKRPYFSAQDAEFIAACDPERVLALIADLDEARNGMKHSCAIRLKKEIERLKAELEKAQLIGRLAYNFDGYKAVLDDRDQLKAENEALRKNAARLQSATAFVQKLCDSAGKQPSVATGYLHDILSALGRGE